MVQTPTRLQSHRSSTLEFLGLSAPDISTLLTVDLAIESQRKAFSNLVSGDAILAERLLIDRAENALSFCYIARLDPLSGAVCKFGSMNPANPEHDLPIVSPLVIVLDAATGLPVAVMDGTSLTTIRTSAGSAVVRVRAIACVLPLTQVNIWSTDEASCNALARVLDAECDFAVLAVDSAAAAVGNAGVVATSTTSFEPVLESSWTDAGTTIVSIGSFAPGRFEIPRAIVERATAVVIDHRPTATEQAGPIVDAIAAGLLSPKISSSLATF